MKMKNFFNQIRFKKGITLLLLLFPLLCLTGCNNLLTPENISELLKHGSKAGAATGGIGVLLGLVESTTQCWSCSVFTVTWNAIGEAYQALYAPASKMARMLLAVGVLFWLTFTIGKMVSQLKEPNMKDILPKIFSVLFKAACVGIILSAPLYVQKIITIFMEPIMQGTIFVSRLVLPNNLEVESTLLSVLSFFSFPSLSISGLLDEEIKNYPVFSSQIGEALSGVIYNLFDTFKGGFALGAKMMFQVDVFGVASGTLILATFFYFMFYFPLLLLEGFMGLGVSLILFPFFLVGWVFPSTKGYLTEVFKLIFQSVAQILVTCIYIGIIIAIIDANHLMFSPTKMVTDPTLITGIGNMNNNGLAFFGMILCLIKLTNDIPNVTSYFVGEMNKSTIAKTFSKMQALMASVAKMAVGSAMAGTGVLSSVGKAMAVQAGREAIQTGTSISGNDTNGVSSGDMIEQTKRNKT